MTRVWLIRHAEAKGTLGSAYGATDSPLSDHGREQARRLGLMLASRPLVRIISSDRLRALATAETVARPHGLVVEPTPALRELDFGAWEGRSLSELWSEDPLAAKAWEDDIRVTPPSFGESVLDLERRVGLFWGSLGPLPRDGELALVGHRGSLAVLRTVITGETVADAFAEGLDLGCAMALDAA